MAADEALKKLCKSAGPQAEEAMSLLSRILGNIIEQPSEPKFRKLNVGSSKLQASLLRHDGAGDFLAVVGFVCAADGSYELPQDSGVILKEAHQAVLRQCEYLKKPSPALAETNRISSGYRAVVEGGARGAGLMELEEIIRLPVGLEALQVFERVILNIRRYPDSEKYRCINLAKPAGQKALPAAPLMRLAGFEPGKLATGEECLQLGRPNVDVLERIWAMVWWATRPGPPPDLNPSSDVKAHALGAVLGAAIGDALGAPLGGRGPFEITAAEVDKAMEMCGGGLWGVAPGQVTGITELSICLTEALAEAGKPLRTLPAEDLALRYGKWGRSMPFRAERACSQAFQRPLPASDMIERARDVNQKAMGAGALTRCISLAALAGASRAPTEIAALAREDAKFSHPDASVGNASVAYVIAAGHLISARGDRKAALDELRKWTQEERASACGKVPTLGDGHRGWTHLSQGDQPQMGRRSAEEKSWAPPGERLVALEVVEGWLNRAFGERELDFSDSSAGAMLNAEVGSVEVPLTHAFRHLKRGSSFEVAMRAVLAGGGDTSTTAAVVGGLVGAAVGLEGLPARWVRAVLTCDVSMGPQRPPEYQPSCLPALIERLF